MSIVLAISPQGRVFVEDVEDANELDEAEVRDEAHKAQRAKVRPSGVGLEPAAAKRIAKAFHESTAKGLLHLATVELQTALPADFAFARDFSREYLTRLCHTPNEDTDSGITSGVPPAVIPPPAEQLAAMALAAPPMRGGEYLWAEILAQWWSELDALTRQEAAEWPGGLPVYLREKNPAWRLVGRVTFHLAENKRDTDHPFAFLATYAGRLSAQGRPQHKPLGQALREHLGEESRPALVSLLTPVNRAAQRSTLAKELVDSGDIFHPQAWTSGEAYRFLQQIPAFEESGLIVRVPDWWKAQRPPRPMVNVTIDKRSNAVLGADSLLDFSVKVALDGEPLSEQELKSLWASEGSLISLRGRWVEVDRAKLREALQHWKRVERDARQGGLGFFEGMRLLSGVSLAGDVAAAESTTAEWIGIKPGKSLEQTLQELRSPRESDTAEPPGLATHLRPYQQTGVTWLRFLSRLGLGACLADDMGLGKTIQVIALLLDLKHRQKRSRTAAAPSLLVVPASLLANWKAELPRFAPSLTTLMVHPSELPKGAQALSAAPTNGHDVIITTYAMLTRIDWLREQPWNLVILDEAQTIKNPAARQTRAVKELKSMARIALTGTPVENRLSDLWSLFDFLNPGLLGNAKAFGELTKKLTAGGQNRFGRLRSLIQPYLLRRLKTDRKVIADLPDKIEMQTFCSLSRRQAALYEQAVNELAEALGQADGIKRRGIVLAYLMRLKQICNHPSQVTGDAGYEPEHSGKFGRLGDICQELAQRQQKVLVFTQFREITAALAEFLSGVFGKPGLVLHGQIAVGKRRSLVEAFQHEDGPPFFVLSLKAGGIGLNLTAASHVIHFDRWWNPAVENQATDRAFRIGQQRNVMVHKFICRGTIEERIDELIAGKIDLAKSLIEGGGEQLLTEMDNEQLLRFVSLDVRTALAS